MKKYYNGNDLKIKKLLKSQGFVQDCKSTKGYEYNSGFFRRGNFVIYYSTIDYRGHDTELLVRTAKDNRDFTGGNNNYVTNDADTFERDMIAKIKQLEATL